MYCPKCGATNPNGTTVCRECGTVLQANLQADLQPQQPYAQPVRTTSGTATASLICGILGLTLLPVIGSILAIILGRMAKSEIKRSGGLLGGDGMATIGLILGYASIGLVIVGTIAAVVFGFVLPAGILGCGLCASAGSSY